MNTQTATETEPSSSFESVSQGEASAPSPLRSMHTTSFATILERFGASVVVSTYQAGKLVFLRSDGDILNTHFRRFNKPMGLACAGDRLAIGTAREIWEYHDVPAVARRLRPRGAARRLLPAANEPLHRRHPDPRDGVGEARSSGSSTRGSPACARSTASTASCRGGGRRS